VSRPLDAGAVVSVLPPETTAAERAALVGLLADAVADGASVGFLAPLDPALAAGYWAERLAEADAGRRVVLVARDAGRVVGAVQVALATDPNGAHRAEVQRLLVLRSHRGRGVGTALMRAAEAEAAARGRTLLVLNTRSGGPPEALYARLGYERAGVIPGFARNPDGTFNDTTVMYRRLASGPDQAGRP
jgi:ribosomal protein S18 acetylase RimI-like enzyme